MQQLPKIIRIVAVEPFAITLLWSTAETRVVNFTPLFQQWETEGDASALALRHWETFQQATISENGTLCWPNVEVIFQYKNAPQVAPLELDALELYRQSQEVTLEAVLAVAI